MHTVNGLLGLHLVRARVTYKFIAARYLYLWIIGIDGWIFSKYIWWLHGSMWVRTVSFWLHKGKRRDSCLQFINRFLWWERLLQT